MSAFESRGLSTVLHGPESSDGLGDHRVRLRSLFWHILEFRDHVSWRPGRDSRILRRARGGLWAYDGWNDLNMVGGEVSNPERNIPIALVLGVAIVGALYMLLNAAVQYVMPAVDVASSQSAASDMMRHCRRTARRFYRCHRHGVLNVRSRSMERP
jgi:hypothetical protein